MCLPRASSSELALVIQIIFLGAMHETWLFYLIPFSFTHSDLDATVILNVLAYNMVNFSSNTKTFTPTKENHLEI
jgi:hypothetical protein